MTHPHRYVALADEITRSLPVGARITERSIVETYKVSRSTAHATLWLLAHRQVLEQRGSGARAEWIKKG